MMANIVGEFEAEQPTDSDEIKNGRFERILDAMQQMQELGQPPKELVGDAVRIRSCFCLF
jgi:peroxin-19